MAGVGPSRLVVSVHGIRTYGQWQERLTALLEKHLGADVEVYNYRYGYFSVIAFLIPPLRWLVTRRFRLDFLHLVERRQWRRIDIVAHSFGTHLVARSLRSIPPGRRPSVNTLIFAGSVLRSAFPWRHLVPQWVSRVINECGCHDAILVLNQLFVLFSGLGGRVGFSGMTGDRLKNRYFSFGHSGFFLDEQGRPDDQFMARHWIPALTTDARVPDVDERPPLSTIGGAWAFTLNNAEPLKLAGYLAIAAVVMLVFYNAWKASLDATIEAERRQSDLGRFEVVAPADTTVIGVHPIPGRVGEQPWAPGEALEWGGIRSGSAILLKAGFYGVAYRWRDSTYWYGLESRGFQTNERVQLPEPVAREGFAFVPGGVVPTGDILFIGDASEHPIGRVSLAPYFISTKVAPAPMKWADAVAYAGKARARLPSAAEWQWAATLGVFDWRTRDGAEWTGTRPFPLPYDPNDGRESPYAKQTSRVVHGFTAERVTSAPSWVFQRPSLRGVSVVSRELAFRLGADVVAPSACLDPIPELTFPHDLTTPYPGDLNRLRNFAQRLLSIDDNTLLMIEAHTAEWGTNEFNIGLGDRHATAIRNLLIHEGVPATRMTTISYGEERLNPKPGTIVANARVTFKIKGPSRPGCPSRRTEKDFGYFFRLAA